MSDQEKRIARLLQDRMDRDVLSAIYGTSPAPFTSTNLTAEPQPALTYDAMRQMVAELHAKLGKRDVFLSSIRFPRDDALQVVGADERFTVAAPDFWRQVEIHFRDSAGLNILPSQSDLLGIRPLSLGGIQVIEIDPCSEDSRETAAWRARWWAKLAEAFEVAMTPLPDWLRAPPKFGKHG
jgi:hypothetical protein